MTSPETLREIAPNIYELIGARTLTLPSRTDGPWHVITIHDGTASCRLHDNRCWAARAALKASEENPR